MLNRVTLEVNFHALGNEAFTTGTTATSDDVLSVDSLHAGAKSKLLLAGALGGLVGAFAGHMRRGVKIKRSDN